MNEGKPARRPWTLDTQGVGTCRDRDVRPLRPLFVRAIRFMALVGRVGRESRALCRPRHVCLPPRGQCMDDAQWTHSNRPRGSRSSSICSSAARRPVFSRIYTISRGAGRTGAWIWSSGRRNGGGTCRVIMPSGWVRLVSLSFSLYGEKARPIGRTNAACENASVAAPPSHRGAGAARASRTRMGGSRPSHDDPHDMAPSHAFWRLAQGLAAHCATETIMDLLACPCCLWEFLFCGQ